jgi:hypothetical protein
VCRETGIGATPDAVAVAGKHAARDERRIEQTRRTKQAA